MRPGDAEIHGVEERLLPRAFREERQRVAGHGAVVARPLDGVLEGAMAVHDRDRLLEFAIPSLALFEDTAPERTLAVVAAAERQDDGKGDLSLAEVVAHVFSELRAGAAVVERVVDELEGDPEVHPVGPTGRLLGLRAPGDDR